MTYDIQDLLDAQTQHDIEKSFAYATGFGVVFVDRNGKHLGEGSNFCDFCKKINQEKNTAKFCYESNHRAMDLALKEQKSCIYICHAGLINIEIPLSVDGNFIGGITAGQVLCEDMTVFPHFPTEHTDFPYQKYQKEYEKIDVFSISKIKATAEALQNLANYILEMHVNKLMAKQLWEATETALQLQQQKLQLEQSLLTMRYRALEKQIMPHFIFNVLNSISRLITLNQTTDANSMLISFSDMLRYIMEDRSYTDLEKDILHMKNYLSIQKIRFPDRFEWHLETSGSISNAKVPVLTLQVFVENCIKHGFHDLEYKGEIHISIQRKHGDIQISIRDNGKGFEKETIRQINQEISDNLPIQSHLGIVNTVRRLQIFYPNSLSFSIMSKKKKVTEILICFREEDFHSEIFHPIMK